MLETILTYSFFNMSLQLFGNSNGIIEEEREGPSPYSDQRRLQPPLD
jgi:hypothetical protein